MPPFNQKFTIHPVGQGLFYSCHIAYDNRIRFRMVFDCGSNTGGACQTEVALYRDDDFLQQKVLDLLVISHFDADHVKFIGQLLEGGIKIQRLVMPLVSFEERIFLLARRLNDTNGYKPEDDFAFRFMIDPTGALDAHLDDDSEIYLVASDPNPIPPVEEASGDLGPSEDDRERFLFDFDPNAKELFNEKDYNISRPAKGQVFQVKDINRGKLRKPRQYEVLMDFLFYKRNIGEQDEAFFQKVTELFTEEYSLPNPLPEKEFLRQVIEIVMGIQSAGKIKELFEEAARLVKLKVKKGVRIKNLNTTALCLLHRNLDGIIKLVGNGGNRYFTEHHIKNIQLFKSRKARVESWFARRRYHPYREYEWSSKERYPNVFLTSDTYLLTQDQVDECLSKYENYWKNFWMVQVPHHGSDQNANKLFLSQLPIDVFTFINYGTQNKDHHPSETLIHDLIATGHSAGFVPVHEYLGLSFEFGVYETIFRR